MDQLRHILALFSIIAMPPAMLYWFVFHGLLPFWRKLGPWLAGIFLTLIMLCIGYAIFLWRDPILAVDYGTQPIPLIIGLAFYFLGTYVSYQRFKKLSLKVMIGIPVLDPGHHKTEMLQDGIYAKIRHPRYAEIMILMCGIAFIANYLAVYLLLPFTFACLYFIVIIEERELLQRFGDQYEDYCRRVPRFIPSFKRDN